MIDVIIPAMPPASTPPATPGLSSMSLNTIEAEATLENCRALIKGIRRSQSDRRGGVRPSGGRLPRYSIGARRCVEDCWLDRHLLKGAV